MGNPGAVVASLPARGRLHRSRGRRPDQTAGDRALPARATPAATADCQQPDTTTTAHGNPDRQPVRCLAFDLAHLPAIATRHRSTLAPSSLRGRLHRSRERRPGRTAGDRALPARATPAATLAHACNRCLRAPREPDQATAPRSAAGTLSRVRPGPLAGDRHQAPLDTGAVVASWPASPIERTKDRPNCRRSSTASSPTSCPRHGNPDRQPVRCLAFDLAHLPAIATRHRSTLAPSSLRGRLHRSRERRPDRTAGDRALPARTTPAATLAHVCNRCLQAARYPDHATATPIGSRCAVSRSPWPTCRRSLPTARRWRRRRFVAGFTNREDEGPTELPMVERCQHGPRQRQPRIARTPRA
jgi:hypothetical protein